MVHITVACSLVHEMTPLLPGTKLNCIQIDKIRWDATTWQAARSWIACHFTLVNMGCTLLALKSRKGSAFMHIGLRSTLDSGTRVCQCSAHC